VAAGELPPYGEPGDLSRVAAFHRSVSVRGITPMDVETPLAPQEDLPGALYNGLREANRLGLVQVTEAGMTDWAYFDALRVLRDRGDLPVRFRVFVASGLADPKKLEREGDPRLEIEGVKFYADGWLGPRTCALCAPFTDSDDGDDGILFLDALTLSRRAEPFALDGWTIATHAIGDRAIETVLDAYENIYGDECAAAAPRIEHAQVLAPHLMERMAHLGVVACIQPGFAVSDAASARAGLGPARMEHAYQWDQLLDAGVRVITGSDYPIEVLSPLDGLQKLAEQLDVDTALALMTDAAAGTTVLSGDPHTAPFHEIEVEETMPA
jgi:predicted amidohydrolase YtcJ